MKDSNLRSKVSLSLARYLGVGVGSLQELGSSRDNIVFMANPREKLIVRVSLNKSQRDVEEEVRLIKYLSLKKFPVAEIKCFFTINIDTEVYPVTIFSYIGHIRTGQTTIRKTKAMAIKLAELHNLTFLFCKSSAYRQVRTLIEPTEKLIKYLKSLGGENRSLEELSKDLEWALSFYNSEIIKNRPLLVIHNDYRIQNVLFNSDEMVKAIIDFDWSLTFNCPEKDIAHAAMELSMHDGEYKYNIKTFNQFIDTYRNESELNVNLSKKYIYEWSKFSAITDAAYYFLSFPEKLKPAPKSYMYDKYKYFDSLL